MGIVFSGVLEFVKFGVPVVLERHVVIGDTLFVRRPIFRFVTQLSSLCVKYSELAVKLDIYGGVVRMFCSERLCADILNCVFPAWVDEDMVQLRISFLVPWRLKGRGANLSEGNLF